MARKDQRVLVINEAARAGIAQVIERARARPVPMATSMALRIPTPGATVTLADRHQTARDIQRPPVEQIELFDGYQCAFSFEEQPTGMVRHLSIAVNNPGKVPMPAAVQMICQEFGFREFPPEYGRIWTEEFRPGEYAVNVAELVEIPKAATRQ